MSSLEFLLYMIEGSNRAKCFKLLEENYTLMKEAWGSSHNHQAWPGGYIDHVTEVMNIALNLYNSLSSIRPLPFHISDAILVLFLHDLEKPWKKEYGKSWSKHERKMFRANKISEYGIALTPEQENAILYVEGEGDDYKPGQRVMNELAAFCHLCDVTSARIWYNYGSKKPCCF